MSYLKNWRTVSKHVELLAQSGGDSDCEIDSFMTAFESLSNESDNEICNANFGGVEGTHARCSEGVVYSQDPNFDDDSLLQDSDVCILSSSESEVDVEDEQSKSNLVCELASWAGRSGCSRESLNDLLHLLRNQGLSLPTDCRTLLKTPSYVELSNKCGGTYKHFGLERGIRCFLNSHADLQLTELKVKVNVDGLPLFKSSSTQFWPILCAVNNYKPFIVTLFCGTSKPSSVTDFLSDFLLEFQQLQQTGFEYRGVVLPVSLYAFICDAPARSFLKCIKSHTGYFSCERCTIKGEWHNRIVYNGGTQNRAIVLRNDVEFMQCKYEGHQTSPSPLISYGIPCVSRFVLDYMHLVCLGVVRRILRFMKSGPKMTRISHRHQCEISENLISYREYIPSEFARRPRSLIELDRWKATEYRQFLLYTGAVAMKGVVSDNSYEHYLSLVVAMTILLWKSSQQRSEFLYFARQLLEFFVANCQVVYGVTFCVYNVHNLIHLADDCEFLDCSLNAISGFPFENFLQKLKKMIKNSKNPVSQVAKRLSEQVYATGKESRQESSTCAFKISTNKRDCCYLLSNRSVVFLRENLQNGCYRCDIVKFNKTDSFFSRPCNSKQLNIFYIKKSIISSEQCEVNTTELVAKAMHLPYKDGYVVLPLVSDSEMEIV